MRRDAADSGLDPQRVVVCARCRHGLARAGARIEIGGQHCHRCVNPAGIVYRVACYREAPGCAPSGEPSERFSWFAGYAWQVALCGGCGEHVGWLFHGTGEVAGGFAGLIADRIAEA